MEQDAKIARQNAQIIHPFANWCLCLTYLGLVGALSYLGTKTIVEHLVEGGTHLVKLYEARLVG